MNKACAQPTSHEMLRTANVFFLDRKGTIDSKVMVLNEKLILYIYCSFSKLPILGRLGNMTGPTEATIQPLSESAILLEAAGAGIMQRLPLSQIGANLHDSGLNLEDLATRVTNLAPDIAEAAESSNRMAYAAEKMKEAGDNLRGTKLKKVVKGKSWIKG